MVKGQGIVLAFRNSLAFLSYKLITVGTGRDFSVFTPKIFLGVPSPLMTGDHKLHHLTVSVPNFSQIG